MAARVLMVQGTASSVGKSHLVAALCRLLHQDGHRVAPFKAWNMALNSAVTPDGLEIGRSTAVQAEAAGIAPTADMNPVLVKPEFGGRAQTIVLGRVEPELARMPLAQRNAALWEVIVGALDRLRNEYDVVIAEGAGSPAEVNLRATDVANMRVALYARAPVLLVGDIDCGGVFASLLGTLMLLEPEERDLVHGLIINKFRGDALHLKPGLDILEQRTGKPVLGVLPYVRDLRLPEEDGVALDRRTSAPGGGPLAISLLRFPHISNFDEFDPLLSEPAVSLRYVARVEEMGNPDLIILPGSKCTLADLEYLRVTGLAERIAALARAGAPVLGICGGYQMLGAHLCDPDAGSAPAPPVPGLGLLRARTTVGAEKRTRLVHASAAPGRGLLGTLAGLRLNGYEIHMGVTESDGPPSFTLAAEGEEARPDGCQSADGLIAGTYMHGLFENSEARRALIEWLGARRGLCLKAAVLPSREAEYDRIAASLREGLDMAAVYRLVSLA